MVPCVYLNFNKLNVDSSTDLHLKMTSSSSSLNWNLRTQTAECGGTEHKQKKAFAGFLLAAGVGHSGGEQQRVDGGLSDEQQKRSVGLKNHPVQIDGASDGHHSGGRRRLAALLVHLKTTNMLIQLPVKQSDSITDDPLSNVGLNSCRHWTLTLSCKVNQSVSSCQWCQQCDWPPGRLCGRHLKCGGHHCRPPTSLKETPHLMSHLLKPAQWQSDMNEVTDLWRFDFIGDAVCPGVSPPPSPGRLAFSGLNRSLSPMACSFSFRLKLSSTLKRGTWTDTVVSFISSNQPVTFFRSRISSTCTHHKNTSVHAGSSPPPPGSGSGGHLPLVTS